MFAGVAAHAVTAWRDIRYATHRREITAGEQIVHCFLFVLPLLAFVLVAVLHWPVVEALFDPATASEWRLHARQPMFPAWVLAPVLVASAVLGVLPGVWEFLQASAAHSSSSSARSATKPR